MKHENWNGFNAGVWQDEINVRDFIQSNYKEYCGDANIASIRESLLFLPEQRLEPPHL